MATARNRLELPGTDRPPGTVHNFFMISMNFHVFLRFSLKFHEFKWTFMFFNVFLDGFHEVSCVFMKLHVLFVCFGDVWCVLMFFFKNFHESSWNFMCFLAIFLYFFMKFQVCWCFLFDFPWFVMFFNALSTFSRICMFCHVFFFRNSQEISISWISKDLYAFYVLFMFFTKRILAKT